jgi:hypothetical protein
MFNVLRRLDFQDYLWSFLKIIKVSVKKKVICEVDSKIHAVRDYPFKVSFKQQPEKL